MPRTKPARKPAPKLPPVGPITAAMIRAAADIEPPGPRRDWLLALAAGPCVTTTAEPTR